MAYQQICSCRKLKFLLQVSRQMNQYVRQGKFVIYTVVLLNVKDGNHAMLVLFLLLAMERSTRVSKYIWILLSCCSTLITSCIESTAIEENSLRVVKSVQCFPDSSFFSDIRHMKYEDGYLYMLDVKRRNVIRLNSSLIEMNEYGVGGRGTGELQAPFSFTVKEDTVSILDFMSRTLKHYSSFGYIDESRLDIVPNDGRMDISKNNDFLIPVYSDSCQLSIIAQSHRSFVGYPKQFKSIKKTAVMNHNHILAYDNYILVIPTTLPYVQLYDTDGKLLKTVNLDKAWFYKKNLSYILNQPDFSEDNISYVINIDAYQKGNNLYILCSRYENTYKADRILVVDLSNEALKKVFLLPKYNYGSICYDGSRFYAFNETLCTIEVLEER